MTEDFTIKATWQTEKHGDDYFVVEKISTGIGSTRYGPIPFEKIEMFVEARKAEIARGIARAREHVSDDFFPVFK